MGQDRAAEDKTSMRQKTDAATLTDGVLIKFKRRNMRQNLHYSLVERHLQISSRAFCTSSKVGGGEINCMSLALLFTAHKIS